MSAFDARWLGCAWTLVTMAGLATGCGATYPGWLGDDDPSIIGTAGRGFPWSGGAGGAGAGSGAAGIRGTAGDAPSPAGSWAAGQGGGGGTDRDGDGWTSQAGDCNDLDSTRYPGNPSDACCDGFDGDCDGRDAPQGADCGCVWETDADGDGWYAGLGPQSDCDDADFETNPGALELCGDGRDNDCDGSFDGADGCVELDRDGDGFTPPFDCDDFQAGVNPKAPELCRDGFDNDCNGLFDAADAACPFDADGDGYTSEVDCDDTNALIHPDHPELCGDGFDNNCDGLVDPYPLCTTEQVDWDGDGYPFELDCNDGNSMVFPGSPWEACCDGIDSDCDGVEVPVGSNCTCNVNDADGDGFGIGNAQPGQADCNDQDATINPGAGENCNDGRDNNCDARVDSADPSCVSVPL